MDILDEFGEVEYTEQELNYIKNKTVQKSPEEQAIIMMSSVQDKFNKDIPKIKLRELTKIELDSNRQFVQQVKNTNMVIKSDSDSYTRYSLSQAISSDISSLQSKKHIRFLANLLRFSGNMLDTSYTKNDIIRINAEVFDGKRQFSKFIADLGYTYNKDSQQYEADVRIYNFIDYV